MGRCADCDDYDSDGHEEVSHEHGHGHAHAHAHGHGEHRREGHGHGSSSSVDEFIAEASENTHRTCADESCCVPLSGTGGSRDVCTELRLNNHCTFHGHCVQLRNTFLHIPCHAEDSDTDNEKDCAVCRYTRSRSVDFSLRGNRLPS